MSAKVVTGNPEIDAYFTKRLSQKADAIEMAIPQQDGREFDECQVEVVAAVPADQDRAAAVEPRQRSLHHPPSGLVGWGALLPGPLVANQRDVRDVLMIDADAIARVVVIAFVEQQVLLPTRLDRWPFQHHGADGGVQHLGIRNIRSRDDRRQRQAMPLDQDGALYPVLGPIGGVGPDLDPPFRAFPMLPSAACHSQSTPLRSSQASMRSAQIASNTCRSDQRTKVRCTELSSGKEAGRWFHWHPVRSRKIIASSCASVDAPPPPRFRGIESTQNRRDPIPESVRNFPERGEWAMRLCRCGHPLPQRPRDRRWGEVTVLSGIPQCPRADHLQAITPTSHTAS